MYTNFGIFPSKKRKMHVAYNRIPQISDMDKCIVEAGKDPSNAKNQFTYTSISMTIQEVEEGLVKGLPSRTCGPSEIFSCAGRSTFFLGGILYDRRELSGCTLSMEEIVERAVTKAENQRRVR